MNQTTPAKWIAVSVRLYSALLILYPVDYRREYGGLMVQIFRDVARDKYRRQGLAGMAFWWCATLLDLTRTVIEQRRKAKFTMSRTALMQLMNQITGSLLVTGGACIAIAAFSQLQPGNHYTYYGIFQVLTWLFAPGFFLVGAGCIGLGLRYYRQSGTFEQGMLYLSGIGALAMAAGVVVSLIDGVLWGNLYWYGGSILHGVALTVFGVLHLRKSVLPVFRALPLQMAGGWLVMVLIVIRTDVDAETTVSILSFLLMMGMGLAWLAIGQAVHRQQMQAIKPTLEPVSGT